MEIGIKALLIEDDPDEVRLLQELLAQDPGQPIRLETAGSLAAGSMLLRTEVFDLVLLDLGLPDSQGLETALALRREFPAIPIVVLTGWAEEELALHSLEMDIQDYLVKGRLNQDQLHRSLRYALEQKRSLETLRQREAWYRTLFDSMDQAYCVVEMRIEPDRPLDYRFIEVNQAFSRHSTLVDVQGRWMRELRPQHEEYWFEKYRDVALTGEPARFEHCARQLEGRWFNVFAFRIGAPEKRQVAILFTDITEQRRLTDEIRSMAYHDALTSLPNRRLFIDILNLRLAEARRHRSKLAILFMDLDRFKEINDNLGHEAGDELLVEVARRLKSSIRESDTVARIGGDEFNILLADILHTEDIVAVVQKIRSSFEENFLIARKSFRMTASIGISIYPEDGEEIDVLFRSADYAMYHVKEMGRNSFQFYNPTIHQQSLDRQDMERRLRHSIEWGELAVYYQPQINLKTGRIVCAEALVRWLDSERELLASSQFIDLAEETGIVAIIDDWVILNVCAEVRRMLDSGTRPPCFTVNLSARRFKSNDFVGRLAAILREFGVPPRYLHLELKEETVMSDTRLTAARLEELTSLGVQALIDDFGTGCSSLNLLKRLPFEKLKIARSFIGNITEDADSRTIVTAIISMAHKMNLQVTAVGVENEAQMSFLRRNRCDEVQGFYLGRPLPAGEFAALMSAGP